MKIERLKTAVKSAVLAAAAILAVVTVPETKAAALDGATLAPPLTVISNATSLAQSAVINLHPGCPLALMPQFNGAGTTNIVFGLDLFDGRVWTTTTPILITNACNNGTNVVGYTIVPPAALAGFSQARWDYTQTTDGTNITLNGMDWSQWY